MKSRRSKRFRVLFDNLPDDIQKQAYAAYERFQADPYHPGLRFKRISDSEALYSVRINDDYRAIGLRQEADLIIWLWIGPHDEYDKRIR